MVGLEVPGLEWLFPQWLVRSIPSAWSSSIHQSRCASRMESQWQVRGGRPSSNKGNGEFWRFFGGRFEAGGLVVSKPIYLLFVSCLKPCSALFVLICLLWWVEIISIDSWMYFHAVLQDFSSPFWMAFVAGKVIEDDLHGRIMCRIRQCMVVSFKLKSKRNRYSTPWRSQQEVWRG